MKYFRKHPDLIIIAGSTDTLPYVRLVKTAMGGTKKILVLNSWRTLVPNLLYNHQAQTICLIYEGQPYAPFVLAALRLGGKRIVSVITDKPTSLVSLALYDGVELLSNKFILVLPRTLRSVKKRQILKKTLRDSLFPSPIQDLGVINMLKRESLV